MPAWVDFVERYDSPTTIAGKFLLSVNDVPEMRETLSRFTIESVATRYTVSGGRASSPQIYG